MASTRSPARRRPEGTIPFGPHRARPRGAHADRDGTSVAAHDRRIRAAQGASRSIPRQPLAREKLMMLARGRDHEVFDRAIDVQVSRLRKLVEPDPANPRYIQTVWGFGYVFVPDEAAASAAAAPPSLRLWPRSLFGRLALLLLAVVALAVLTSRLLFRVDRATLLARQFGETKLAELQAMRAALAAGDGPVQAGCRSSNCAPTTTCGSSPRPSGRCAGAAPGGPLHAGRGRAPARRLGPETEIRFAAAAAAPLRARGGGSARLLGRHFRCRRGPPSRIFRPAPRMDVVVLTFLLIAAFLFARYLARPLRELKAAVARVGRGEAPAPLPESGPSEIAALSRGFNPMVGEPAADRAGSGRAPRRAYRTTCARRSRGCASGSRSAPPTSRRASRHGRRHRGDGSDHRPVPRLRAQRHGHRIRIASDPDAIVAAASTATRAPGKTCASPPGACRPSRSSRRRSHAWWPI